MNLESICLLVCQVAKQAGEFMVSERRNFTANKIEVKGQNDFVSYVDKAAERIIVDGIKGLIPEAGFLTEEETIVNEKKKYTWVIDPLDGTTNYIHGLSPYAVSIGLIEHNEPILGVVYVASTNECFYTWKNSPAYLNGNIIRASNVSGINNSLFITGFPYNVGEKMKAYSGIMEHLTEHSHGVRRLGSAAADLVYVACGYAEAFYQTELKPWDKAAGVIIAKQAGAIVTEFDGGNDIVFGKSILAAAPGVYNEVKTLMSKYF